MTHTLTEIAQQLSASNKKVKLIYAFNGSGKTLLSREFIGHISSKSGDGEPSRNRILYYNSFTEDLFYWENLRKPDATPKLRIQQNSFTDWVLNDQGRVIDIVANFQHYATDKITPVFNAQYQVEGEDGKTTNVPENSEVTFRLKSSSIVNEGEVSVETDDDVSIVTEEYEIVKVSKGEESSFIWSVFVALIDQVVSVRNQPERDDKAYNQFKNLEYVFIDDPVSSLDENHLIELAVSLAKLVRSSKSSLKFVITTHNPLFYNVLFNEINKKACFQLAKYQDGTYDLMEKSGDSNHSFSYHLHLKKILEKAVADKKVEKYHFTLLRNLYEKTSNFLGYSSWSDLLVKVPGSEKAFLKRTINYNSHRTLSSEEVREPTE